MLMSICLVDLHKTPKEGVNQYTQSIRDALKRADDSSSIDIVKVFYSNLDPKDPRVDIEPYKAVVISGSDYHHSHKSFFLRKIIRNIVEDSKKKKKKSWGIFRESKHLEFLLGMKLDIWPTQE